MSKNLPQRFALLTAVAAQLLAARAATLASSELSSDAVENMGLEPTTSWLQTRRSTS